MLGQAALGKVSSMPRPAAVTQNQPICRKSLSKKNRPDVKCVTAWVQAGRRYAESVDLPEIVKQKEPTDVRCVTARCQASRRYAESADLPEIVKQKEPARCEMRNSPGSGQPPLRRISRFAGNR